LTHSLARRHDANMSSHAKPTPPKACPVCQVAMQATRVGGDTVHRCERCSLTVTVKAPRDRREP
jgi:hypothetical protein